MPSLLATAIAVALVVTIPYSSSATAEDDRSGRASHLPAPTAKMPADTTVLDRATIEGSGATDLVELLRLQPGVDIVRGGGSSRISHVLLRGANARQVLVLIDGARVASAGSGEFDFASLALDQIQRIEILRGPRSAEYGSDALGGVIRIATRVPTADSTRLYAGRYGRLGGSGSVAFVDGSRSIGMTVGGESYDGNLRAPGGTVLSPFPDRVDHGSVQRNLSLAARTAIGEQQLEVTAHHSGGALRSEDDAAGHLETDPDLSLTRTQALSVALGGSLSPDWSHELLITASHDRLERRNAEDFFGFLLHSRSESNGRRTSVDWTNRIALSGPLELHFGVHADRAVSDHREQLRVDDPDLAGTFLGPSPPAPTSASSQRTAASVGLRYGADDIDAALDLRHDHLRGIGDQTSPALSLGWQFHPALQATFRYAEGYRAASLDERALYPHFYGYPDVAPEHVRNLEAGLLARWGEQQHLEIATFRNRYDDLLIRQYASNYPRPGIDEARADGVELDYGLASGPWTLDANATVQDSFGRQGISGDGGQLPFHPRQKATVQFAFGITDDFRVGTELFTASRRVAESGDTTSPLNDTHPSRFGRLPGYALVNLHAAWTPHPSWRFDLRLDNVGDRHYQLQPNDDAPGRAWFASVRWSE